MKTLLTTLTNMMAFVLLTGPIAALAQYDIELIDYPGAPDTQAFGINNRGDVVGDGIAGLGTFPFVYDSKKGNYSDVTPLAGYSETTV